MLISYWLDWSQYCIFSNVVRLLYLQTVGLRGCGTSWDSVWSYWDDRVQFWCLKGSAGATIHSFASTLQFGRGISSWSANSQFFTSLTAKTEAVSERRPGTASSSILGFSWKTSSSSLVMERQMQGSFLPVQRMCSLWILRESELEIQPDLTRPPISSRPKKRAKSVVSFRPSPSRPIQLVKCLMRFHQECQWSLANATQLTKNSTECEVDISSTHFSHPTQMCTRCASPISK